MKNYAFILLILVLVALVIPVWRASDKVQAVATVVLEREERSMQVLETVWTSAGPMTQKVTTPRKEGESEDAWQQRHATAVAGLKANFPPI